MEPGTDDEDEALLFYTVYCSRAAKPLDAQVIQQILSVAQRNNADRQITGWLVYGSGIFFQWLEGNSAAVKRLMTTIIADPRHDDIVILDEQEEVRERLFSGWDMELVPPEDIRTVLQDAILATDNERTIQILQKLLAELDSQSIHVSN